MGYEGQKHIYVVAETGNTQFMAHYLSIIELSLQVFILNV